MIGLDTNVLLRYLVQDEEGVLRPSHSTKRLHGFALA
jgi:predicted nucleic-acid-binding protein